MDNQVCLLSIIVPVYNAENYLDDCLKSLLNQSVDGGYEIICVDDGSSDMSAQILERYSSEYEGKIFAYYKENSGVSSTRNYAISKAKGKYLAFVDSDDLLINNSIGKIVDLLEKENASVAIMQNLINVPFDAKYEEKEENFNLIYETGFRSAGTCCRMVIEREIVVNNDILFPENMKYGEDTVFCSICSVYYEKKKCLFFKNSIYKYRQNPNSAMNHLTPEKSMENQLAMLDIYQELYKKIYSDNNFSDMIKALFKYKIDTTVSNLLFTGLRLNKYLVNDFKREGLYPYPFLIKSLKNLRSKKELCLNLFKFFFPIRLYYDIVFKLKNIKKK
ncbi:MAG: glycosyltransferase family 2 protein [Clostridia bacterium]|nr:glycosyltransferase family 2 protein [Clostridia bacterium]